MKKTASILDYSMPMLDPAVWGQDMKLFAFQKDFILRLAGTMYETYSFKQPEAWIDDIVIIGSLTTNKWLSTSDMDVHARVNLDNFIATNMPGATKQQAFDKLDSIRKEFDRAKILAPMTQHPIEFYFECPDIVPSTTVIVGVYSVLKDTWLKEPYMYPADLDFEESKKDVIAQAEALAEELDGSFGKVQRDIQRIDELEVAINAWGPDKQQLFYAKVEKKLAEIEAEILKDVQIKQTLVDARHAEQNPLSDTEIKFKWLARFGFFGILQNLKNLLKETGGKITTQELPLVDKILSQGTIKEAFLKEAFESEPKETDTDICIDFDRTIAKPAKHPAIGEPIEGAKESLAKLQELGYTVVIYSCRGDTEEGLKAMEEWLDEHDMPYDSIFSGEKPFFKYVIDDRAIEFDGNWSDIIKKVEKSEKKASASILKIEPYGGGVEFPILVNPTRQQVARSLLQAEEGQLRVLQGNNSYIWDAMKATHDHVMEYLSEQGLEEYSQCQTGYISDASLIDDFSWKKASLHIIAYRQKKLWFDPNGKKYEVGSSGAHADWIIDNADFLEKKYGFDSSNWIRDSEGIIADFEGLDSALIATGWSRIGDIDNGWGIEVADLRHIPEYLMQVLAGHSGEVTFEDINRDWVIVNIYDFETQGQKAVNRALTRRKVHAAAQWPEAFYLSPTGIMYPVQRTHDEWLVMNTDLLKKEYNLDFRKAYGKSFDASVGDIMDALLSYGWTRGSVAANGKDYVAQVNSIQSVPNTAIDFFLGGPDNMRLTIEDAAEANFVTVTKDDLLQGQKGINKAFRIQSSASKAFSKIDLIAKTKKVKQGDYSCLMALVPHELAQEIVAWGVRNIPDEDLYLDGDKFGRELESHVTIKYGLLTDDAKYVRRSFNDAKPFHAKLGKVRHFEPPELPFDVLTVEVISDDLFKANEMVCDKFDCAEGLVSDEYKSHITIAYMKRGKATDYVGYEGFAGKELDLDTLIFSPRKGNRTYFSVSNDKESSFILQEINKFADYGIGNWAESAWISPEGEVIDLQGDSHEDAILELLDDNTKYDVEDVNTLAITNGWTRFGEMGGGGETGANVKDIRNINPAVFNHAIKYSGQNKEMVIADLSGKYVHIPVDEFVLGQNAVNKALASPTKTAEFLPSLFQAPDNRWQFEHGGDDKEIALNPDSVSDDQTAAEPCTTGKPRSKDVWRQFMSIFRNPISKKDEMTVDSAYDPALEEANKKALGEDETALDYSKGFYDPKKHDFPHNTTWDSLTQDGEPSKPTSVTYSPQISNDDNLDQNSPDGFPHRFMGKPKGEWFSDEGEIVPALQNMWRNRKAAIENITASIIDVDGARVFVNPTGRQVYSLFNKSKDKTLRYYVSSTGELYVWDAFDLEHASVMEAIGDKLTSDNYAGAGTYTNAYRAADHADNFRKQVKQAGSQSASVPDYLIDEWKTDQIMNDTDEEPYVNHDQRDYPYGMHDSPENTGYNIGWPKDNQRAVVRLDTLENPAYRLDPFGIGEYNVTWYTSLPASDGIEKMNPE